MFVYLITSKHTYSRAVVVARSIDDAARMHPAERTPDKTYITPDGRGWKVATYGGFPRAQVGWRGLRPDDAPNWPTSADDVEVTVLGRAQDDGPYGYQGGVVCYQPDPDPRL